METGTTKRTQSLPTRPPNLFHQILSPKALIVGDVLATVWIYFLGFQIVRVVEACLPLPPPAEQTFAVLP